MHENVKQWLNRYSEAQADLDDLRARRDALIQRSEAARTSFLDGMPHGKGGHSDLVAANVALIEDLNAEIAERATEARALYNEIDGTIKRIKGRGAANMRCVLQCRYLDGHGWAVAAEILFGRNPNFEEKSDNFLRRVHLLHAKALAALEILVPDLCGTGNDT